MAPAALEISGVTAGYGPVCVLNDVTVVVPAGTVVAIFGPNGAGKTTLLRVASGLVRATSGRVSLNGCDVTRSSVHERARRGLCDVPEGRGIFPSLTVRENLVLQATLGVQEEAIGLALRTFPALSRRLKQVAGSLSGGEQQMLAISRAFITNPEVVVVDEVSLGLAPIVLNTIFESLAALAERGTALLIVEQYVSRALRLANYVYILNRGSVVFAGASSEVQPDEIFETYLNIEVT